MGDDDGELLPPRMPISCLGLAVIGLASFLAALLGVLLT